MPAYQFRFVSSELAEMLQNHLDRYAQDNPFNVLVYGINADDGIGDFVHIYDFYRLLKQRVGDDQRIKMTAICKISEKKLAVVKKIDEFSDIASGSLEDFIITQEIDVNKLNPKTHLALPISYAVSVEGAFPKEQFSKAYYYPFWECEAGGCETMGIESYSRGIKIITPIISNKKIIAGQETTEHALQFEKAWLNTLFPEMRKKERSFLGAGYANEMKYALFFINACLAQVTENHDVITIAIDQNLRDGETQKFLSEIQYKLNDTICFSIPITFMARLEKLGITRMQHITAAGETIEIPVTWSVSPGQPERLFRIIHLQGISNHDKYLLLSMADSSVASGDTSFFELICASNFPVICKKTKIMKKILRYIQDKEASLPNQFDKLKQYIEKLIPNHEESINCNNEIVPEMIQQNREAILQQWKILCEDVIKNRDVSQSVDYALTMSVIHSIRVNGTREEKTQLQQYQAEIERVEKGLTDRMRDDDSKSTHALHLTPEKREETSNDLVQKLERYIGILNKQPLKWLSLFRVNPKEKIRLAENIKHYLQTPHDASKDIEAINRFIKENIKINGLFGRKGRLRAILTDMKTKSSHAQDKKV